VIKKGGVLSLFERFAEKDLNVWFQNKRRKPLILRGARQVGKSTLVKSFAEKNRINLVEVNLEKHMHLDNIFRTLNIEKILTEIEALTGKTLNTANSLLFLDEIQASPHAIQSLRYFYEEKPEIPVIAAGSLLEFTLANHNFSMPVGRIEYQYLGPMTFKEYIASLSPELLKYFVDIGPGRDLPVTAHSKLLEKQRQYMFTGGMPEAVSVFSETGSMIEARKVHSSIVDTYIDDFSKYARSRDLLLLQKVFRYIPEHTGKKIKYSNLSRENRAAEVKNAISMLVKARIFIPVIHSNCSGLPLNADTDEKAFKLIFMDIGLANYISGLDWFSISNLSDRTLINEGPLAEQFIGQHLNLSGFMHDPLQLNYWIREAKTGNAEIDFVVSRGRMIIPIEVKAGKNGTLKSVHQFVAQKTTGLAVRFDMNEPSLHEVSSGIRWNNKDKEIHYRLLSLPLYAVEELERIIDETIQEHIL